MNKGVEPSGTQEDRRCGQAILMFKEAVFLVVLTDVIYSTIQFQSVNNLKKLLTLLLTLFLFSSVYADEQKITYYPTVEFVDGKVSKVTVYYKTGEVKQVVEYDDGKPSKATIYYPTGEVNEALEFVDGKRSKVTVYYKTGEVEEVVEFVNGKPFKAANYNKNGEVESVKNY